MKKIFLALAFVYSAFAQSQTHVEFDKDNFPNRKDEYKEAKKSFEKGKELFVEGRKNYDGFLEYYVGAYGYFPVSRYDYQHVGDEQFKQALPFLEAAQKFNPDHALLNYLIGMSKFHLDHQKEDCLPYFEKAIKLNPKVAEDLFYLSGWAFQLHAKWDKAIEYYDFYFKSLGSGSKFFAAAVEDVKKKTEECKNGKNYMANPERVFIDNLGPEINGKFPDYSVLISTDESMLIFTSRRDNSTGMKIDPEAGGYFEDLYVSYRRNGKWTPAANLGPPINTESHDATAGISPDGSTLYIYEYKEKDGGDIYESKQTGMTYSKPEHMNKNINSKFHESTVSESFDSKNLYFVSDKEGGIGNRDIYVSTRDAKGQWGPGVNLGPAVNTKYAEEGILMHPDGKTLYFSSKGHRTMGGYDIFKVTFENGKWGVPQNLGWPINSPDDDVFFVISGSGRRGYYASEKEGGYGEKDLYMITFLGPEKKPELANEDNLIASIASPVKEMQMQKSVVSEGPSMTLLKGVITDAFDGKVLEANIELVDNVKNEVIATFKSNSASGKYLVSLPSGRNYGIAVKREGYLFHSENFDIPLASGYQEVEKDIQLKNVAVGTKIVLKNIFFDFDKATLRPESTNELERLLKLLNDLPTLKIELGGHTDSKGSDEYNIKLSQARCESVVNYLVGKGIAKDRLVAKGYGETQPVATNDTDEGRQLNRRTEFTILSK